MPASRSRPRSTRRLATEAPRPARIRNWAGAWTLAVATVCFGAFMGQLDASIVTLTYGPLQDDFRSSLAAVEWVSLAYLLVLVVLLVPVGRLSDARGRKLLYTYGFVVFTAASAACGLAPTLGALIGFRVVQAAGAAMLQANSVALVTTSAPADRMRVALGIQAAAQALGLALGPTVGGVVVATIGWRWVFILNVPVGVVAIAGGILLLPRTRDRAVPSGRDTPGTALLALAIGAGLLAVSAASGLSVPGWAIAGLAATSVLAGWGLVRRERTASAPLLDLAQLAEPTIAGGLLAALCGYLVLFGPLVLVPEVLAAHGRSAAEAGLVLTALPAGFALAATLVGRVLPATWADDRRCRVGAAAATLGLLMLLAGPSQVDVLLPGLAVVGLGLGTFTPSNNASIMGAIPARTSGTGGGLLNMARGLGTALGVAAVALTLHVAPGGAGGGGPRDAILVLAVVSAGALVLSHRPVRRQ